MARILRATHRGEITIGGRSLPCAVPEDGTRVLNQTEMFRALGRRGGAKRSGLEVGFKTPTFFDAKNLQPFIDEGLRLASKPIKFKPDAGAAYALGYKATLLPEICKVYLAARTAGQLHHSQLLIAEQCEVLVQGLATVGIIALVDEATGYQEDRARKALEKILEEFISDKLLAWAKTFPDDEPETYDFGYLNKYDDDELDKMSASVELTDDDQLQVDITQEQDEGDD